MRLPLLAPLLLAVLALLLVPAARAGVWLVNHSVSLTRDVAGVDVALVAHKHAGNGADFHLEVDGDPSDSVGQSAYNAFKASTSQASCDTSQPWGGFYSALTSASLQASWFSNSKS